MPLNIVFSAAAIADLEHIWLYTLHKWSLLQADRYYAEIIKEIDFLSQHPDSGKAQSHIREGYRAAKVKSHLIFYRVAEDQLEVMRILHANMDLPRRLNE